ncbi:anti-sigma factor [Nibribacter koreensis]|uniref:Anti-sigma factor n=1 Tax=Nibribacter koreensis TaxID=1084519 RepID=A0ABP8FK75_9BACT
MKDRLEDFVKAHRDEFDSFAPRPDLWQEIASELEPGGQTTMHVEPETGKEATIIALNWNVAWRYAAAVAMLVSVFLTAWYYGANSAQAPQMAATQPASLEKIAPELKQIETQFVSVIEQKESQLQAYDLKALGMDKEWEQEAKALDASYNQLKQELYTTPNKAELIQAMSDNLKMRIAILNRQLAILENIQTVKQQNTDETTSI